MKMRLLLFVFTVSALTLSACGRTVTVAPTPTSTSLPAIHTPTATEVPYESCSWNWATQPLPELSVQVQAAMEAAGLTGITATAEAYGENCLNAKDEVVRFAAMETDFRITIKIASLNDREALGTLLENILLVLDGFPTATTPGPQPGYVGVAFQAKDEELRLWFLVEDGESARALGLRGAALLDKLLKR
jgi:ABC-type glycerol-3-phosphate transport system substrate-binding protein